MTDPSSSSRFPTDPITPGQPAAGEGIPPTPPPPTAGTSHDSGGREQAAHLGGTSGGNARDLAGTTKAAAGSVLDAEKSMAHDTTAEATDQAKATLAEAKTQIKDLWQQSRSEITEGAGIQLQRLSTGARAVSDELHTMASASDDPGIASDLARRASGYLATASEWLDNRGPDEVFSDVKHFARRSPGTFLAIAAGLGLVAGRVSRSLKDDSADTAGSGTSTSTRSPEELRTARAPRTAEHLVAPEFGAPMGEGATSVDQTRAAGQAPTPTTPRAAPLEGGDLR